MNTGKEFKLESERAKSIPTQGAGPHSSSFSLCISSVQPRHQSLRRLQTSSDVMQRMQEVLRGDLMKEFLAEFMSTYVMMVRGHAEGGTHSYFLLYVPGLGGGGHPGQRKGSVCVWHFDYLGNNHPLISNEERAKKDGKTR